MDYIEGYKAYNKDFTDKYGNKHFAGEKLHIEGEVKVGPFNGNGFHLCKKFEDTFRYVPDECILCEVIGFGKISNEYIDYYYDYDGIYACSDLYIKRVVPREEIVEMAKQLPDYRLERLIQTYSMTDEEIKQIENSLSKNSKKIVKAIDYYHRNQKDAYKRED